MVVAVILAGGSGLRFGLEKPKQFVDVLGKPVIAYTLERFNNHSEIDEIIVPCITEYIEELSCIANKYNISKLKKIIPGGATFQESFKACIYDLCKKHKENDIVLMHMSISPMVSDEIISDSISVCKMYGNAYSAEPSYKCMCEKTGENFSERPLAREVIYGLNTPQSHYLGKLTEIYKQAEKDNFNINAEPHISSLMFAYGEKLFFSSSSSLNIKITTQDDLELFKALLNREGIKSCLH